LKNTVGVWAESHVTVSADPHVRLFVAQAEGPAERALLVIHGGPDGDHSYLREPVDRLAGRHHLILPDLRGCGRSTRDLGEDHYTPAAAANDLAVLLDALGVARRRPGFS
jgi:pimeloyl-ACP methyl ester carboxylesterase